MATHSRPLWRRPIVLAALCVLVAGAGAWAAVALSHGPASSASAALASSAPVTKKAEPPPTPLQIVSVTPSEGAQGVVGTTPIHVTFSARLADRSPLPDVSPSTPGTWTRSGPKGLTFTPKRAFMPYATVTVTVPGGPSGVRAADGGRLGSTLTDTFGVEGGSVLRLQQLLSLLGYSPLSWTPAGVPVPADAPSLQAAAAFDPPQGTFAWTSAGWPAQLTSTWAPGGDTVLTKGLVMAFEADHGLKIDGIAGPEVWAALFQALAQGQVSTGGYTFALASKALPETLTVWHNGQVVLQSPANTGIAVAPTVDGTFPVYERLRSQVMQGTNPDGSHYADPVQYVAYFNGGDAVHYIARSSFGYPQSLGCVELPLAQAATAWPYLAIGSLVTVAG